MNFIGIDPSLISTGMVVNGKLFNYCRESDVYGKNGMSKWFKTCDHLVTYRYVTYEKSKNNSEQEIMKLCDYDQATDLIISDTLENIDQSKQTYIGIEGYSFSSQSGPLVDLVTFSTLLRKKLYDKITKNINILAPSSLKLESCKMTYPVKDIGIKKPKLIYQNNDEISGGSFKKNHMFLAITENKNLIDPWAEHLRSIQEEMLEMATIKKPYEDVNDAFLLYQIMKNKYNIN
jgi:hypothetical protein